MELVRNLWLNEANGQNFEFSPFSIDAAMGLLAAGSNGRTLQQMLEFLKSKNLDDHNSVVSRVMDSLDQNRIGTGHIGPKLRFVNGIWVDSSCTLKPSFKETASSIYEAKAEAVDFKTKVREEIN
ncbi:Serpin family [Macleaya cordata]|uniref:Serpin family n=1 Tax=Macleaya cordata TaxID=56857 RepID=A0A200QJ75_MACCD|nr:Serpin family [Macleaya cordata]